MSSRQPRSSREEPMPVGLENCARAGFAHETAGAISPCADTPLFVDLYELTMAEAYLKAGCAEAPATFSLFARHLPERWGYLVAAGLTEVCALLAGLRFREDEIGALDRTGRFGDRLLERLRDWRFTGRVRALPEGTPFAPPVPVLEVDAPMIEAQLVETLVLNAIHVQSLMAAKASRCAEVAGGRPLVDFSMRRDHGPGAAMAAARAGYIGGVDATSNVLAGARYGIPTSGTMAHSMVQAFPDETSAFRAFAHVYPDEAILLVDTFDTVAGIRNAIVVGQELRERGHRLRGVRLDSGDLGALAKVARRMLDDSGETQATVFVSGGLDEDVIAALLAGGAPIDGFGIGSRTGVVQDAPVLDMAYKLVAFDGEPTLKLSSGKATLPGPKQAWRRRSGPHVVEDVLGCADEDGPADGTPLLATALEGGVLAPIGHEPLETARLRLANLRQELSSAHRGLDATPLPVRLSPALVDLRDRTAGLLRARHGLGDAP